MTQQGKPMSPSYSAMGGDRYDYEACYSYDKEWFLTSLHCHDFYELYIHYKGARFYCIDNHVYPLEKAQLMVIPPFRMHGLIGDSVPMDYERCFLYISPTMLKICGGGQLDLENFLSQHTQAGVHQFCMTDEEAERCKQLMQELAQTQKENAALSRFENFAKLLEFLSLVCRVMNRSDKSLEPIVVNEAMQEILSYINRNYTSAIKLDALARQFGVSVSFLSHEFVKYTGRSVYDYVLYRRVLMAKELICSAAPLNEVAYQCGFNDYSSFLRSFTKIAGMSPSAYRKQSHLPQGR